MSDHLSTQQLINRIETADRRYRRSTTVLLIVIGAAIALSIFLQYQALEQFKSQSAQRSADNKVLQESIKRETEKTNSILRCIAVYFANPNRDETVIQDIDKCTIDPTTGAVVYPGSNNRVSVTPGASATKPNNDQSGESTTSNTGTSSGSGDPPERNFIQQYVTDPLFKAVNDGRAIIGL